jgi:hypothetical protein
MQVLLPAGLIPLGSVVTKRTGQKTYVLADKITVYVDAIAGLTMQRQEIRAEENCVFMVSDANPGSSSAGINAVGKETMLMWHVEEEELRYWLDERVAGTPQ